MISKHKAEGDVFKEESMVHAMHLWNHRQLLFAKYALMCLKKQIFVCLGRIKAFFIKPQKLIALGCDSVQDLLLSAQDGAAMR